MQNALADKEDLQKQLKEMEQRTFRADHAEALESRLNEAREEMEVLAKDLAKSFNIDPNGVGASSLRGRPLLSLYLSFLPLLSSRYDNDGSRQTWWKCSLASARNWEVGSRSFRRKLKTWKEGLSEQSKNVTKHYRRYLFLNKALASCFLKW